ncbi:MAG: hypothetical protein AAGF94_03090 [Pseudomonadota bacterium]
MAGYEDLPRQVRNKRMQEERLRSEWRRASAEFQDDIGNVDNLVLNLRQRARRTQRSARIVLVFLLITVIFGLGTYVIWPLVQENFDGRRQALLRERAATDTALNNLNNTRREIADDIIELLKVTTTRFDNLPGDGDEVYFGHAILPDGDVLIYGNENTLFRLDLATDRAATLPNLPGQGFEIYYGHAELPDGDLLIYGSDNRVLRYDPESDRIEVFADLPGIGDEIYNGHAFLPGGDLLLYGDSNTILRLNPDTGTGFQFDLLPGPSQKDFVGHTDTIDGDILLYGTENSLLRYSNAENSFEHFPDLPGAAAQQYVGHVDLPDGELLLYGDGNRILRFDPGSGDAVALTDILGSGDEFYIGHAPQPGSEILFYGDGATILRYDVVSGEGQRLQNPLSDGDEDYYGHAVLPNGDLLIYGSDKSILQYGIEDKNIVPLLDLPGDGTENYYGHATLPGGNILFYGDEGTILRHGDHESQAAALEFQNLDDDAVLAGFLNRISPNLRRQLFEPDRATTRLLAVRSELDARLEEIEGELAMSSDVFALAEQRENFAAFMATCRGTTDWTEPSQPRGVTDADPDRVTLACTQAWQAELSREDADVFQTLAKQAPPGILLLFLLGTLGALYRYNVRLAGFHDSRADVLELLKASGSYDGDRMLTLSDALAADKVEFGKGNTPADQAVDIARAVLGRAK